MGIARQIARIIVEENEYKPFRGEILLCGRQSIYLKPDEAVELIQEFGALRQNIFPRIDSQTRGSDGKGWILDESFFELFTEAKFNAVDVSDYEGANIIHDMAQPVPPELYGQFAFIFNGSVMDNMSNPGQFIQNTSRMLAPGGVILNIEHGSLWRGAYLMYSCDYFHDFYAVNRYADCKAYSCVFDDHFLARKWNVFQWDPGDESREISTMRAGAAGVLVLTIAEKGEDSTDDIFPLQAHYRPEEYNQVYRDSVARFRASLRPILHGEEKEARQIDVNNFRQFCGAF